MRTIRTLLAIPAIALLAACGGASAPAASPSTTPTTAAAVTTTAPLVIERPAAPIATVARADHELAIFAAAGDATPASTLPATTSFGSGRALLVIDDAGEWLQVQLPARPNGATGWIRRADVELRTVDEAITVDLAARTLTVTRGHEVLIETPVAIGSDASPTPTGSYYLVDKLDTTNDGGAYGPFALGLSGHSDVLTDFAGGDGQIGIHGTNDPSSIGEAVSHGCVRVPNEVAVQLNDLLPLGTPVTIV